MLSAIILAGGLGSRLHPLTKTLPKPLIPLAGKPILQYIVDLLKTNGFDRLIVAARYLGHHIVDYYSGSKEVEVYLIDSKDTADVLRILADVISKDCFLVSMGDVLTNAPVLELYRDHVKNSAIATIGLKEVENPLPYGLVFLDERRRIVLFTEKPISLEVYLLSVAHYKYRVESSYWNLVNTGFYMFDDSILTILKENESLMDFGRHVFPFLLENDYELRGWIMPAETYWSDIGRIETYKEAAWDLLDNKVSGVQIPGVLKSSGIRVGDNVDLKGELIPPVYIGSNVVVEEGAKIGPYAIIEDDVVVGKNVTIHESIIWHKSLLMDESYVYDSILMNNVVVKPGVKIVSSVIGAGNVVSTDLYRQKLDVVKEVSPYAQD
ncbi:sugar phosphate nucleotidyltransferase [Thermosphaera sp.]